MLYLDNFMQELTKKLVAREEEGNVFWSRCGKPWVSGTAGQRFAETIRRLITKRSELGLAERHTPDGCRHTWDRSCVGPG